VGAIGLTDTEFRVLVGVTVTVITVYVPCVVLSRVALTKMPPVMAVVPAVKFTEEPLPMREPSAVFVRAQEYVIPVAGQVALHVGVAVKPCVLLDGIDGDAGATDTDLRVTAAAVTVITVDADTVFAPRVALT
jgi:hypothetical protein